MLGPYGDRAIIRIAAPCIQSRFHTFFATPGYQVISFMKTQNVNAFNRPQSWIEIAEQ